MAELSRNLPPYQRIARKLRDQIVGGVIQPGDRIPSTRELVESEGVAKATIDKAMRVLREEGLVESVHGVGLLVVENNRVDTPRDMFLRTRGVTPMMRLPNERSEFRHVMYDGLPASVARHMGREEGERAVCRSRLIYRSERPVYVATSWYPAWVGEVAPKLLVDEPIPEGTANYVQACTGRNLTKGRDNVRGDWPNHRLCWDLWVKADQPLFAIESSWYDNTGEVLEQGVYHIVFDVELSYEYELLDTED